MSDVVLDAGMSAVDDACAAIDALLEAKPYYYRKNGVWLYKSERLQSTWPDLGDREERARIEYGMALCRAKKLIRGGKP